MAFGERLEDLIALNRVGAVEPLSAIEQLYAMQDAQKAKRQEAQQAALATMAETSMAGAEAGMGLESLLPLLSAQQSFMGTELKPKYEQRLAGGLESLFDPTSGTSLVAPPAGPTMTTDDREGLFKDVEEAIGANVPIAVARQRILGKANAIYGPGPETAALVDSLLEAGYGSIPVGVLPRGY